MDLQRDNRKWDLQETGGAAVTISATEPSAPLAEGELWLKRDSDLMLIYDGDVWFEFPSTGGGGGGATTLDGLTDVSTTGVTPMDKAYCLQWNELGSR